MSTEDDENKPVSIMHAGLVGAMLEGIAAAPPPKKVVIGSCVACATPIWEGPAVRFLPFGKMQHQSCLQAKAVWDNENGHLVDLLMKGDA